MIIFMNRDANQEKGAGPVEVALIAALLALIALPAVLSAGNTTRDNFSCLLIEGGGSSGHPGFGNPETLPAELREIGRCRIPDGTEPVLCPPESDPSSCMEAGGLQI